MWLKKGGTIHETASEDCQEFITVGKHKRQSVFAG